MLDRLQKLETILRNPTIPLETLTQFFQNQPELRTLKITLVETEHNYSKALLLKIFSICSELIDFRFKCNEPLEMDEFHSVLRAVSGTKIECLMIWILAYYTPPADFQKLKDNLSTYLPPLMNERLRILKLNVEPALPDDFCLPILKHFCNLRHLDIAAESDRILQTIFEYHVSYYFTSIF